MFANGNIQVLKLDKRTEHNALFLSYILNRENVEKRTHSLLVP